MNAPLFPEELLPLCSVPAKILAPACLASYLLFTRSLEIAIINPQFVKIACNQLPWAVSGELQKQAFEFYLEEASHAQWSQDLLDEFFPYFDFAEYHSGILGKVEHLKSLYPRDLADFFDFVCFVASECLISQNLAYISTNKRVHTRVREYVSEHAKEEARHRAFCLTLLRNISQDWSRQQKNMVLQIAHDFAHIFLSYDEDLLQKITGQAFTIGKVHSRNDQAVLKLEETLEKAFA